MAVVYKMARQGPHQPHVWASVKIVIPVNDRKHEKSITKYLGVLLVDFRKEILKLNIPANTNKVPKVIVKHL